MKNILKAIRNMIDGVYHYVDKSVKKATESIVAKITQPDWNQNDPTAPDYVKNRPFWADDPVETVLFEGTVVNDDAPEIELVVGQEYTVTLDGVEYVLTALDDGDGGVFLGSESLWGGNDYVDTEPPFVVGVWYDETWFYTINEGEEYTLRVFGDFAEIHKIDEKYLPDTTKLLDENENVLKYINVPDENSSPYWGVFHLGSLLYVRQPESLNDAIPTYSRYIYNFELPSEVGQTTSKTSISVWYAPNDLRWGTMFDINNIDSGYRWLVPAQHTVKNGLACAQGIFIGDENQIYCIKMEQDEEAEDDRAPTTTSITRIL